MTAKRAKRVSLSNRFTKELSSQICEQLANGKTLTAICRQKGITPAQVYQWTHLNAEFAEAFYKARDFGDQILEDEAIDLSDENDFVEETNDTEGENTYLKSTSRRDNVARSRLRSETRLKVVARRKGARITQEIKMLKKSDDEMVATLSTEELLKIARMKVNSGE